MSISRTSLLSFCSTTGVTWFRFQTSSCSILIARFSFIAGAVLRLHRSIVWKSLVVREAILISVSNAYLCSMYLFLVFLLNWTQK